jgi:flagellar FliL protein
MAEEEVKEEGQSGGGMKKIIILVVIGILLIAGSVGGTLFFLNSAKEEEAAAAQAAADAAKKPQQQPAIYFPIKPPMVINFSSKGRRHLLQVSVTIMSRDSETMGAVQTHLPLIKNHLSMLISGEVYEDLQTDEGRELMRQKALEKLNQIMEQETGKPGIEQILFEGFVMQ